MARYIVGVTGASGSVYALRLIEVLLGQGHDIHLVLTDNGLKVLNYEMGYGDKGLEKLKSLGEKIVLHDKNDLFAPIASGSFKTDGMIIIPCSMATLGEISNGISKSLLGRAADVCIKEKRKLIIVPRETPLSSIHLRNMLNLSEAGVTILPAMPAFYHNPRNINDIVDFVVGKVLDCLGIDNNLFVRWGD